MKPPVRRFLVGLLRFAIFLTLVWLICSYLVVARLTGRVRPKVSEPTPTFADTACDSFRLTARDGVEIGAWFIDGKPDRPIVLLLHGHGASRTNCLEDVDFLRSTGSPVMLISFRAHGDSEGDLTDFGLTARWDVIAAIDWLNERHPGRSIAIWGKSMGAAASLFAARELGDRVSGYVLECPYQDLRTATRNRTRVMLPPGLEYVAYRGLSLMAPLRLDDVDAISPLRAAGEVPPSASVLVLAGGIDRRATPDEARAIHAALGERARLLVIENGDHAQLTWADAPRCHGAIRELLDECVHQRR